MEPVPVAGGWADLSGAGGATPPPGPMRTWQGEAAHAHLEEGACGARLRRSIVDQPAP